MISYGRCGTHWVKRLISESMGVPALDARLIEVEQLQSALFREAPKRLIYEHFSFDVHGELLDPAKDPDLRLILLHRHPLDFFISATWFRINVRKVLKSPDPTVDHGEIARGMLLGKYDAELGECYEQTFRAFQKSRIADWVASNRCHELRYENLIDRTEEELIRCLRFLEIQFDPADIPQIVARNRFEVLSGGRMPGVFDGDHHYRNGLPGEWRRVFRDEDLPILRQKYGDLFAQQGYPI